MKNRIKTFLRAVPLSALLLLTSCGNVIEPTEGLDTVTTTAAVSVTAPVISEPPAVTDESSDGQSDETSEAVSEAESSEPTEDYPAEASGYYSEDKGELSCTEAEYTKYYLALRAEKSAADAHTETLEHFARLHEEAVRAEQERLRKEEEQRKAEELRKQELRKQQELKKQEEANKQKTTQKQEVTKPAPVKDQGIYDNDNWAPIIADDPDELLYSNISGTLSGSGLSVDTDLPNVVITSVSRGADTRAITLAWDHSYDESFTSYAVYRSDASGKSWNRITELDRSQSSSPYSFTDNISGMQSRYFRYAVIGIISDGSARRCSAPTFTQGWAKINICLDPGHYLGCNSNGTYSEGTQMLLLGMKLRSCLTSFTSKGVPFANVRITRTGSASSETFTSGVVSELTIPDKNTALRTRGVYAKGCDFFISLHTNAMSNWNETNMWAAYSFPNLTALGSPSDYELAFKLGQTASRTIAPNGVPVESRSPFGKANVIDRRSDGVTHYKVLRGADSVGVPGILLEQSFHTNPAVRGWLMADANLNTLARAEAVTILRHYGFPVE